MLTDSHLLELLNPDPDSRYDFSWVKPGLAVWDWRINGAVWDGFTYGMSYPSWVRMVDFAAEQGFKYLVLDANWYGPEFESDSDPVKGEKAQDVQRLLKYGKEKGVGIWLYLNDVGGRKYPIEKTLKQYGDWGAAGVKYGFMSGTQEEKNRWTKKITELCAQNHLLVDFHDGPVHPYGQMRTWPNAVTREYCHAQLDGHHVFEPKTFVTTVFVNMVAGPIDMNNGMFDLRQGHTTRVDESQPVPSTLVSEAARTLIAFSGVTILPDIPEYYRKYPALLNFLSAQKMPWKESRTLAGEIGEYIVMMRETEDAYLVGAATNESGRTIDLPLSFLEKGKYTVEVIEDGDDAHYLTNRESLKVTTRQLTNNDKLTLKLAPGGGASALPGKLVENNYFVLNLNEPNQIANTSWIKPGQVIREVTLTTAGSMASIDFAAENNIAYVLFDAGWYGAEEDVKSDATTVTVDPARSKGPLDLPKVIEYANSKGVGILVYVNKKALHQQLDEILPLYKKWGIKGVKYGFVNVGDQYATAWLHQAVRKAAKYGLMVDIHDEYRSTGYSRTYPNLLTQESIRGDEESPSLDQAIYTLYNRMICGAGDYTNCYFAERVTEKMGGRAAQLAKLVAIYSPWQFVYWYDRPEKSPRRAGGAGSAESVIKTDAATRFYNSIPTVWDETRFLEGEMGKYAVVARCSGSDWYVSMLNAGDKKQISLPIDFLKNRKGYTATLYYQASEEKKDVVDAKKIRLENRNEVIIDLVGNSGCVLHFSILNFQ